MKLYPLKQLAHYTSLYVISLQNNHDYYVGSYRQIISIIPSKIHLIVMSGFAGPKC